MARITRPVTWTKRWQACEEEGNGWEAGSQRGKWVGEQTKAVV